jgi:hypothetical protein
MKVLRILMYFLPYLSERSKHAAISVLVPGGVVELTVVLLAEGEVEIHGCGSALISDFAKDTVGRRALSVPKVVDKLIKWFANCLKKVRDVSISGLVSWGAEGKRGGEQQRYACMLASVHIHLWGACA